jgi:hypothetical protein
MASKLLPVGDAAFMLASRPHVWAGQAAKMDNFHGAEATLTSTALHRTGPN